MLAPEQDFDTWSSLLIATTGPGGEFSLFLPSFQRLFAAYCKTGSLAEPLTALTTTFVDMVVPSFLFTLLRSSHFSYSEIATIKTFLIQLIGHLTTAYLTGLGPATTWLLEILNCKAEIYGSAQGAAAVANPTQTLFSGLVSSFTSGGRLEALCARVPANPTFPSIEFVLKLIDRCGSYITSDVKHSLLKTWQSPLQRLLSSYDQSNLRDLSTESLSVITEFINQDIPSMARILDPAFIEFLWQFADLCFRSSFLEKQIIGAKLIARLACHFKEECQVWAVRTQFIPYIINEKVHEKVMTLLTAIPQYICDGSLPLATLTQLYRRVNQLHSSQADVLSKFLSNALKSADESLFSDFLKEISQPLTPSFFGFLVIFARDAICLNPGAVRQIISFLLQLTDQGNAMADDAIARLCDSVLSNDTRTVILEHVLKHIHLIPTLGSRRKMFTKLVKTAAAISDKVQSQLMTSLFQAAEKHPQHDFDFIRFVKLIIKKSQSIMPIEGVAYLFSSDRGWAMFAKLLKVRQLDFLDRATARGLFQQFGSIQFANVTLAQCDVIQEVILAKAIEQKSIELVSGTVQRRVVNPWLDGMTYLMEIVTIASCDKATQQVLMFILELYQNATLHQYLAFFKNIRPNFDIIGLSEQDYTARLLRLVHAMVLQYEGFRDISIFGLTRHKSRHRKYITFIVKVANDTVEVHCSPSVTGTQLAQLVASKLKIVASCLYFRNRDVWVNAHEAISKAGVKNGSVLHLTDKYYPRQDPAPPSTCVTAILSNLAIPDRVYEVIQSPDCSPVLRKCAWRFLMWMPTVKRVLDLRDEDFVTLLANTKTTLHLQYLLQAAQVRAVRGLPSIVLDLLLSG
jgi:hypothetical protein